MELVVTAPNRIDLAGGTTDLYPLYLLLEGGFTVNLAVNVRSRVIFRSRNKAAVRIVSEDLSTHVSAQSAARLPLDGPLSLVARAVRAFPPGGGVEILTHNHAPQGSGLGASSALLVALLAGLLKLRGEQLPGDKIIDLAASIETATIGVPAGKQDYIAAYYGGLSFLEFGYHGFARSTVSEESGSLGRLAEMLVLSYTGVGRFSGMNNWEVTKAFIEKRAAVQETLRQIRDVARDLADAIRNELWVDSANLINREWELRRALAPGITTPRIEAIANAATAAGALASKVCGAGGGGCMVTVTSPERRSAVEDAIAAAGGTLMPFEIEPNGVREQERRG